MKRILFVFSVMAVLILFSCDAPTNYGWEGKYQKNTWIYTLNPGEVGYIEAEADPDNVSSTDDRIVVTATVYSVLGTVMQGADVTFTTDTGFFRSDEFGPSEIFTTESDTEGKAYAHLLHVGRTTTIKVESGDAFVHVVITFAATP